MSEPSKPNSRWAKGKDRYPATDPRRVVLTDVARARTAGWRNGARVVKR